MAANLLRPFFLAILAPRVIGALNPACAPGGNFDLSLWELQLPTGSSPGHPTTISSSQLQGCGGFQDAGHQFFFTESGDGALVMKVPGSPESTGCITTQNSEHCRTELRETNPKSWDPNNAVNRLRVTLAVPEPDNSSHGTVIGQIHINDTLSNKPVCELFYSSAGVIVMGVEQTRSGGNEKISAPIATIPPGQTFTYEIRYESNVLSVNVNDQGVVVLDTFSLDAPSSYFKVGNYNQGDSPSDVHFFAISVTHSTASSSPPPPYATQMPLQLHLILYHWHSTRMPTAARPLQLPI
ncbi:polysaccharide lyase family 7 protein [Xylogone sp. PMI_703]|nr:polysaccharide lyase family 7 protein [Xylogone sp. PMI_703]